MELELKHLAPYLPYGLQGIDEVNNYYYLYGIDSRMNNSYLWMNGNFNMFNCKNEIKPILRPLSDLTKEISNGVGLFYPFEELNLCYSDVTNFLNEDLYIGQWWDYEKVSKLIEWHFDIFGLIENGLAIDINTL